MPKPFLGCEEQLCEVNSPLVFSEAVYSMALFGNVFHTNCTIFNLLQFLCLEGTERSLCCALLPLMRVYVLPWLLRGCQSPGWLSWHLCKSQSFSSLCQGATCPNKSSPVPSLSFYQWNYKWMAQWTSKRSSRKASQQNRRKRSHLKFSCPSHRLFGEIWKEPSCFLKWKNTRASSLLLAALEILRYTCEAFVTWSWV